MTARAILFASALLASASAHGGTLAKSIPWTDPPLRCPLPTFNDCRSPAYYDTDCGIEKGGRCPAILNNAYQAGWTALTATKQIAEPANMTSGGYRNAAKLVPFPASTMVNTDLNASANATYIAATMPSVVAQYQASSQALPFTPPPAVTSCADYVYKKYYDYSVFEAAARGCGTDLECVYAKARVNLAPPTLYSLVASNHPPTPITPQIRPSSMSQLHVYQPKNGFFEIPPYQILQVSKYASDPAAADIVTAITTIPTTVDTGDRWAWHRDMHDRNAAEQLTEDDYLEQAARMDAYRLKEATLTALLKTVPLGQRQGLSDGCGHVLYIPGSEDLLPPSIGGGSSVGGGVTTMPCTPLPPSTAQTLITSLQASMADDLIAEWHHVRNGVEDHGCLAPDSVRCDWSPRRFANEYVGRLQGQQTEAYARCMNATGNAMPSDPAKKADWIALEDYFGEAMALMAEQAKALPWKSTNGVASTNTLRVQGPSDHRTIGIPSVLAGEYDYDLWWELRARTAMQVGGPKVCSLDTELATHLKATFTAPEWGEELGLEKDSLGVRVATHQIVDGALDVSLNRNNHMFEAAAHLVMFDQTIVSPFDITANGGEHISPPAYNRTEKLFEYEEDAEVFGIPVYVYIHVDGSAGYEYEITTVAPPPNACATNGVIDEHNLAGAMTASLTPHANVHATADAGVGIRGVLSIGTQADLDVVTATLPITQSLAVVVDPGNPYNPAIQFDIDAHLDANLMAGSISLYAEALFERTDKEIVHWPGFHVDEPLHKTLTIPLLLMSSQFDKK